VKNNNGAAAWPCVILVILLLVGFAFWFRSAMQIKREIRFENEYVYGIWNLRDAARKSDPEQAAKMLFELQDEPFAKYTPVRIEEHMEILVREERKRAMQEIIGDFRARTGKDLGDKPGPWILAFGDEAYKQSERQLESLAK
jgi:hypothetical protein